jgi:hypothetical protein
MGQAAEISVDPHVAGGGTVVAMKEYTVGDVARLSHVSVRTLHHYDDGAVVVRSGTELLDAVTQE